MCGTMGTGGVGSWEESSSVALVFKTSFTLAGPGLSSWTQLAYT